MSPYKIAVHEIDIFLLKITLSFTLSIRIQWARCSVFNAGEECVQQSRGRDVRVYTARKKKASR